jgi:hypothetical protein
VTVLCPDPPETDRKRAFGADFAESTLRAATFAAATLGPCGFPPPRSDRAAFPATLGSRCEILFVLFALRVLARALAECDLAESA